MRKRITALLAGAMFMIMAAGSAMALPYIDGTISFVGNATYTGGTTAATATGISFLPAFGIFPGELVASSSGAYSGLVGQVAAFQNFTFNPVLSPNPVDPLWTITTLGGTTYDFTMTNVIYTVTGSHLILDGFGTLGITGYADTFGTWLFSTEDNSSFNLTFSATSASVPEPGTMVLLGFGLLGLAIYGKRRMNKEA